MAELKTKPTKESIPNFLNKIEDSKKKKDSVELLKIFKESTKEKPAIWGKNIVGFGKYYYESERSSQKGNWFLAGFSPRKPAFSIYIMAGFKKYGSLLKRLGKFKKSSGCCLYVKNLEDINTKILRELIKDSSKEILKKYAKK